MWVILVVNELLYGEHSDNGHILRKHEHTNGKGEFRDPTGLFNHIIVRRLDDQLGQGFHCYFSQDLQPVTVLRTHQLEPLVE